MEVFPHIARSVLHTFLGEHNWDAEATIAELLQDEGAPATASPLELQAAGAKRNKGGGCRGEESLW